MHTATSSPDEIDVHALERRVRELESLLKISELRCAKLQYKLDDLLRRVFGPKNEKLDPAQRLLFGLLELGELPAPLPAPSQASGSTPSTKRGEFGRGFTVITICNVWSTSKAHIVSAM